MINLLSEDAIRFIVARVLSNAKDAKEEYQKKQRCFFRWQATRIL